MNKTRKSLAKRFSKRKSGKLLASHMSAQHLARRKSKRARRQAKSFRTVAAGEQKLLQKFLPNI
ncbi:MAG: 50S ribosomal protein L35 [Patescibacteria group bacterium]